MPNIYLKNQLYNELIRMGKNPTSYVNEVIEREILRLKNMDR